MTFKILVYLKETPKLRSTMGNDFDEEKKKPNIQFHKGYMYNFG